MDQTMPPSRTNNKRGERTICIKITRAEKKGFTVALASTALWKETSNCDCVQRTWRITGGACSAESSHSTQCTSESLNKWLDDSGRVPTLASSYLWEGVSTLLIVDSYKPHQTEDSIKKVKDCCNSDVIIIPGGCTSIVQPMDKRINRPFKEYMRASWQEWMQQDRAKTKKGNLKQPSRQDAINWVFKAWESIKLQTLTHFWCVAFPMLLKAPKMILCQMTSHQSKWIP